VHYLIVGNGVAGVTAALKLRERDSQAAITVISDESDYFFSRTALMYAYMDRMSLRDLEPFERKVYEKKRIRRIRGRVIDLDAAGQHVDLETGSLRYNQLLLATGSVARRSAWPGLKNVQSGIVSFVSLKDLELCERQTRPGMKAVVVGGGLIGIELVECLRHHGVQVTYLIRERWYMEPKLSEAEGRMVEEEIGRHKVNVKTNELIASVASNLRGELSAITTEANNTIECSLLGVCIGVQPNVEWLRETRTPPEMRRGVIVDRAFRTTLPNVFACGDCAEVDASPAPPFVEQTWYSAKRQGELAALSMLGDRVDYALPMFYNSAKFFEMEYTAVGTMAQGGHEEFFARVPGRRVSIRIHEDSNGVRGFSLLGSRWDSTRLKSWIEERRPLAYVIEHLEEAQFDVEFGRQTLAHVRAEYNRLPQLTWR
jgi:NAD(P)H-nitrite reductase large subunit